MMKNYHTVLSIAGSDSIGGAGIQADIKTCCAMGVYAMTAVTAITAQNTLGVDEVELCRPEMLRAQIRSVVSDVRPDAVKIGMIGNGKAVEIIAEEIRSFGLTNVVVDPIIAATSGDSLSGEGFTKALHDHLAPLATLLTPNLPEAAKLTGIVADDVDGMRHLASMMSRSFGTSILLKGGHLTGTKELTDVLVTTDGEIRKFTYPPVNTPNTHGTGCSLSSAIAANLAGGLSLSDAIAEAEEWLHKAIEAGADYAIGSGHGPINHLFNIKES
jgi:hydroxymethylpyrimidine/phosphomethylpyrimidine kinase